MRLRRFSIVAISALMLAAPAFADPEGIKVSSDFIVSPVVKMGNLERWAFDFARARNKPKEAAANSPDIWTAREPSDPGHGGDFFSSGLIKIGFKDSKGESVILRLWSRNDQGGSLWIKPMKADGPDVLASYSIQIGNDAFVLKAMADGAIHVDGVAVGKVG